MVLLYGKSDLYARGKSCGKAAKIAANIGQNYPSFQMSYCCHEAARVIIKTITGNPMDGYRTAQERHNMNIVDCIFGAAYVLEPIKRTDNRGEMNLCFHRDTLGIHFRMAEQRIYRIPRSGTFFGIHYQDAAYPQAKLITVIQGSGLDYIVDLRKDSPTYRQWKAVEVTSENARIVYIPAGFGHGFLSTADDTIQLFAVDAPFMDGAARCIHYADPGIGLKLPVATPILSEKDKNAPFWEG